RAVERGTGECTIVVAAGDHPPAVVRLALYICLAGLALGVERVEGKLEIVLGRFERIDGTARDLSVGSGLATDMPWRTVCGSSATLRRNASMRLTTRCGGAKVFLRSGTAPACLAFRCASSASS